MGATQKQLKNLAKARRAKKTGTRKHSRRRVSTVLGKISGDMMPTFDKKTITNAAVDAGLVIAGLVVGKLVNEYGTPLVFKDGVIDTATGKPKATAFVFPAVQILAGGVGALTKNPMLKSFGIGMAASGVIDGLNAGISMAKPNADILKPSTLKGISLAGLLGNEEPVTMKMIEYPAHLQRFANDAPSAISGVPVIE